MATFLFIWLLSGRTGQAAGMRVRVGLFPLNGFYEQNEQGEPEGYGREWLDMMAEKANLTYEYVWTDNFSTCIELLRENKVDMLAPAGRTASRVEEFVFSDFSLGTECGVLLTPSSNDSLVYEDFAAFDGLRVGYVEGSVFLEPFEQYEKENGFKTQLIPYRNSAAAIEAMKKGQAEAALVSFFSMREDTKLLAKCGIEPFYFMFRKEDRLLTGKVNDGLRQLIMESGRVEEEMMRRYFPHFYSTPFSRAELDYIENAPVLTVGCPSNICPVSYLDEETGEVVGITREVLEKVSGLSGLRFRYVPLPAGTISYDMMYEQGISLISSVENNWLNRKVKDLNLTTPYMDSRKVFVSRPETSFDDTDTMKVAVATGSATLERVVQAAYPHFTLVVYDTMEECFEAVRKGETDLLLQNQYVVSYLLAKPAYENLVTVPADNLEDKLCLSIVSFEPDGSVNPVLGDERLLSVLNKAIEQVNRTDVTKITISHTAMHPYKFTLGDFLFKYRVLIFCLLTAFLLLAALLTYIYLQQKSFIEKLSIEQKKDSIFINNSGNIVFEMDCRKRTLTMSSLFLEKFGWIPEKNRISDEVGILSDSFGVHETERGRMEATARCLLERKEPAGCLVRVMKKDGGCLWCNINLYPMMDARGELVYIIGSIEDVDAEVRTKQELEKKSRTDAMTGLLNKEAFYEAAESCLKEGGGENIALAFIDMDNFKQVNDTLGHLAGDQALRQLAEKLQDIMSAEDVLARFGGDEFCILIRGLEKEALEERLAKTVERCLVRYEAAGLTASISMGAVYTDGAAAELEELMELADKALYEAKEAGRNRYVLKGVQDVCL